MCARGNAPRDLTVVAVPMYFATMALEHWWSRRRARAGFPSAGDYERRDTIASLSMGMGSLVVPLIMPRLLRPFTPGRGRWGKAVVGVAAGAALLTTAADLVLRRSDASTTERRPLRCPTSRRRASAPPRWRRITGQNDAVPQWFGAGLRSLSFLIDPHDGPPRPRWPAGWPRSAASPPWWPAGWPWPRSGLRAPPPSGCGAAGSSPTAGSDPLALALAIAGWDFIYYWNHRLHAREPLHVGRPRGAPFE